MFRPIITIIIEVMILITEFNIMFGFLYGVKYNHIVYNKKGIDSLYIRNPKVVKALAPTLAQYQGETNREVRYMFVVSLFSHKGLR
jgi:hypothetical protein